MYADLVIKNGKVITIDSNDSIYDTVAIKDNEIIAVGNINEIEPLISPSTNIIDLKGRSVIPGFVESHIHTAVMGVNALAIDCRPSQISSIKDLQDAIYERAKNTPKGSWIRGWGYNDQYLKEERHPNKWDIDKVAPNHPVMLTRVCNHISIHNTESINIAKITNTNKYNPETFTRINGEFSGIMKEEAHMSMFKAALLNEDEIVDGLAVANDLLLSEGITSIHDSGGYGSVQMRAFQKAINSRKLKLRLYSMIFSFAENLNLVDTYLNTGLYSGYGNEHFKIGPVKLMIDGSSSGPTAATFDPYAIDKNNYGILSHNQDLVNEYISRAYKGNWQVTSHAVGDKGVSTILNAIEFAKKNNPSNKSRPRIEHCAMINDELIRKIKKLNVVPISNPIFLYEFGDGYIKNYGKERAFNMFTAKSFIENGIIAAGASDCPITFSNPLMGMHLAVNRITQGGVVINKDECITPMQALRMFTYNGAYASQEEDIKGSIEVGKLADLTILNSDFTNIKPEKIKDIKVDMTIIDGKIEYERT